MEIFKANQQWSTRPADERFASLEALHEATKHYAMAAQERPRVPVSSLSVVADGSNVSIVGKGADPAVLTNWAFGQLCARVGAPAGYVRELPAALAVQNINHGLALRVAEDKHATLNLLFHVNASMVLRSLTSEVYSRIWNFEVAERLLRMQAYGWAPAMPDIRADIDPLGPRPSLYASDHDLFAFICHGERTINEPGNPDGLKRGLIVENSEVGAGKYRLTRFLYREMCGNHIIWGAEHVVELSAAHVGDVRRRSAQWDIEIRRYIDAGAGEDEARIANAKRVIIAADKDKVIDLIFGRKSLGLSRKAITAGYEACQGDVDGDPRTPWGLAQGLTRYSQTLGAHADKRNEIDRAAGRVLEAF